MSALRYIKKCVRYVIKDLREKNEIQNITEKIKRQLSLKS